MKARNNWFCFLLSSSFFFVICIQSQSTNAAPSRETWQFFLNTTNEIDPGHFGPFKSEIATSNQSSQNSAQLTARSRRNTENIPTCGTNETCSTDGRNYFFCIGSLDQKGNIVTTCPTTHIGYQRCWSLEQGVGFAVGEGKWCCEPKELDGVCTDVYRTCTIDSCRSRYCVAIESERGVALCPGSIMGILHDKDCNNIAKGSTKWLGEGKWCCKAPQFCNTAIRKCGVNSQCEASFCHTTADKATICPKSDLIRSEIACNTLSRGVTKNLGNNIWSCNADHCDTDVKACGGGYCTEKYCIGLRNQSNGAIIKTKCPSAEPIEDCLNLPSGKEIALDWNSVCCNTDNCLGTYRRCGRDMVCGASFCITRRLPGSIKSGTTCPTPKDIETNAENCGSLLDDKEYRIDLDTYCCKASDCPMSDTLSAPGSSSHIVYPVIIALLIFSCVGIAVLCYFIGEQRGTKGRKLLAAKDPSEIITVRHRKKMSKVTPDKKPTGNTKNLRRTKETEGYANLSAIMKQPQTIDDPTLKSCHSASKTEQTVKHQTIEMKL